MSNILTNNINPRSGNVINIGGVNDTVSIAGTVTYEDVTSVDSIGIITARSGVHYGTVGSGVTINAVGTGTSLGFLVNNSERARIDSSGRFGIGDAAPDALLSIKGNSDANTTPSIRLKDGSDTREAWITNASGDLLLNVGGDDNVPHGTLKLFESGILAFTQASGEKVRIDSSGRLLVGTSSESGNARQVVRGNTGSAAGAGVFDIGLGTTRPGSAGTPLGYLRFTSTSNTGSNYHYAAIHAETDGTSSSDTDIPGRLVFSTTADGASSPTERMRITSGGNTLFSNSSFVYPATDNAVGLGGGASFRWSAVWAANGTIQTSDQRAKANIADATLGSDFIKALRPVSYKWIEGGKRDTGERDASGNYIYESVPGTRTHWGFIAQEVKQAVDDAGVDFGGWVLTDKDDPDSQQALRYDQFIAPLTKALQEALAEIESLKARVTALEP